MRARNTLYFVWLTILCLIGTGCEPNRQYWKADGRTALISTNRPAPVRLPTHMHVIEFDEMGDFWERNQFFAIRRALRKSNTPLLVTFVHGWQNNARPGNGDLDAFGHFIHELRMQPSLASFDIHGLFIGWRGAAVNSKYDVSGLGWVSRQLSFWNRKAATDRIAGIPLSQTLWQLGDIVRERGGRSIVIGHSFGGRIIEQSLARSFVSLTGADDSRRPADLVVLINSASEAIYARQLQIPFRDWKSPAPAIISLTAKNDWATDSLWQKGTGVSNLLNTRYRRYPLGPREGVRGQPRTERQKEYITRTAGHDDRLVNQILDQKGRIVQADTFEANFKAPQRTIYTPDPNKSGEAIEWILRRQTKSKADHLIGSQYDNLGYWIIQLPPVLLSGHSGQEKDQHGENKAPRIFTSQVQNLLAGLFNTVSKRAPANEALLVPQ